jgi:hypothetical protein
MGFFCFVAQAYPMEVHCWTNAIGRNERRLMTRCCLTTGIPSSAQNGINIGPLYCYSFRPLHLGSLSTHTHGMDISKMFHCMKGSLRMWKAVLTNVFAESLLNHAKRLKLWTNNIIKPLIFTFLVLRIQTLYTMRFRRSMRSLDRAIMG